MADYAKLSVSTVYSASSDYSDPIIQPVIDDYVMTTAAESLVSKLSCAITTGATVEMGTFTTPLLVIVKNRDTTNFVEARWTSQSTANKQKIRPGGLLVLTDLTVSADLVLIADTTACICEVYVYGV